MDFDSGTFLEQALGRDRMQWFHEELEFTADLWQPPALPPSSPLAPAPSPGLGWGLGQGRSKPTLTQFLAPLGVSVFGDGKDKVAGPQGPRVCLETQDEAPSMRPSDPLRGVCNWSKRK